MTEWQARDYNRVSSLQQAMAEEQLARLTLKGSERILDVGCGDGKISAAIAERVPAGSVVGIDPSHDMIAFASNHFSTAARGNLRFEVADVRRLPFRAEFDLAVSFNALHWVPEQAAALESVRAALAPGGEALLGMVPQGPRTSLEDVIEEVRRTPRWADFFAGFRTPFAHFSPEEYRTLAERARFRVVRVNVEDKAWDFKTRDGFLAWARATFAFWTQHVPEREWNAFITDVLDRYQTIAADTPSEVNTFKFYQMEVVLDVEPHVRVG
jgi:trans-aconitate methyltransferase